MSQKIINGERVEDYTFLFWGAVPYDAEQKRSEILIESVEQFGFRLYKKSPLKAGGTRLMEILYVFRGNFQQITNFLGVSKDRSGYETLDKLCYKSGVLLLSCRWFENSEADETDD